MFELFPRVRASQILWKFVPNCCNNCQHQTRIFWSISEGSQCRVYRSQITWQAIPDDGAMDRETAVTITCPQPCWWVLAECRQQVSSDVQYCFRYRSASPWKHLYYGDCCLESDPPASEHVATVDCTELASCARTSWLQLRRAATFWITCIPCSCWPLAPTITLLQ